MGWAPDIKNSHRVSYSDLDTEIAGETASAHNEVALLAVTSYFAYRIPVFYVRILPFQHNSPRQIAD